MKQKCKSLGAIAFGMLLLFSTTSCEDKDTYNNGMPNQTPSTLSFSTTQDVKFDLAFQVATGYASVFNIYEKFPFEIKKDENGNERWELIENMTPLTGGIAISGKYASTKNIPDYITELYAYSPSLFAPQLMKAKVENGMAKFEVVDLFDLSDNSSPSKAPQTRTIGDRNIDHYLKYDGTVGDLGVGYTGGYLDIPGAVGPLLEPCIDMHIDIPADKLNRMNQAFPEKMISDSKYYGNASIYLEKEAEVWVSVIRSEFTAFENNLSYFYYNGTKEELNQEDRKKATSKEILAIPLARTDVGNGKLGLKIGDYVKLKYYDEATAQWVDKFPANTTIGWILRSNGYDRTNQRLKFPQELYYSRPDWNWNEKAGFENHTVIFNAGTEEDKFICFGFEDQRNSNTNNPGDMDCNDVMFHVMANPTDAIKDNPPVTPEEDLHTTVSRKGILAFEDCWPDKGDYDLNDVVIRYESQATLTCKANSTITYLSKIEDKFSLLHSGAHYSNMFAYKIEIEPSYVESVTINGDIYTPEADNYGGKNGFVIYVCRNVIDPLNGGIPAYEIITNPPTYEIVINFKDGIKEEDWEKVGAPYNPFISPMVGKEIHLPFYYPTQKIDETLFGTLDDRSVPEEGIYFVRSEKGESSQYPFAIHLSNETEFKIPTEKQSIATSYPNYKKWVESNGELYKDWYLSK